MFIAPHDHGFSSSSSRHFPPLSCSPPLLFFLTDFSHPPPHSPSSPHGSHHHGIMCFCCALSRSAAASPHLRPIASNARATPGTLVTIDWCNATALLAVSLSAISGHPCTSWRHRLLHHAHSQSEVPGLRPFELHLGGAHVRCPFHMGYVSFRLHCVILTTCEPTVSWLSLVRAPI